MQDKDEKIFRYIKLRITENFNETWYSIFQHVSNFALPILLILSYINRLVAFNTDKDLNLDFTKITNKINEVGRNKFDLFAEKDALSSIF